MPLLYYLAPPLTRVTLGIYACAEIALPICSIISLRIISCRSKLLACPLNILSQCGASKLSIAIYRLLPTVMLAIRPSNTQVLMCSSPNPSSGFDSLNSSTAARIVLNRGNSSVSENSSNALIAGTIKS